MPWPPRVRLAAALAHAAHESPPRAAALMIQGTSSNAGKSVLTAALCRILLQDGIRVAPFKSQNMSLNSFIARDGGEMGRAQVVQAQACRLEPDVRMNPILLKPNSDTGCQVIVRGKPVGNMRVGEYVRYKPQAFAAAKECYDALAAEFDAIVLEGRRLARRSEPQEPRHRQHADGRVCRRRRCWWWATSTAAACSPSFVGTMEVLAPWERKRVAGWIVNRFRGDASLLGPGAGLHAAAHGPARAGRGAVSGRDSVCPRKIRSSSRAARSIRPAATRRPWKSP